MHAELAKCDFTAWLADGDAAAPSRSTARKKSSRERRARRAGLPQELPSAAEAAPLFREKLEVLSRATEDLKHRKEKSSKAGDSFKVAYTRIRFFCIVRTGWTKNGESLANDTISTQTPTPYWSRILSHGHSAGV